VQAVFGIEPLQLMEIAGWLVAHFVDRFLDGARGKRILVVAGSGNNGGDALVAARFLHQRGAAVEASVVKAADASSLAARHVETLRRMGIALQLAPAGISSRVDVIIDGLLGTGIRQPLRQPAADIIQAMNAAGRPIIAIDVPSGLDADTGAGAETAVQATATISLATSKAGLRNAANAGRVFLADIGMPTKLFSTDAPTVERLYQVGELVELIPR
jgi:NAD(P)H-hydrate epimerase